MTGTVRRHVVLLAVAGAVVLAPGTASAQSAVPYTDPQATGFVGLCDASGHQVTSGDISTAPVALNAVSSQPAPAPYNAPGRTATLYAFQPRQNVAAGQWSGEELTAASRYTDAAHPMTAPTPQDSSLADFLADFPASWDGLVQLRIYLGAPNHPINSASYPATDIRVTGQTWQVVDGGTVDCSHAGKSKSVETLLLPSSVVNSTHPAPRVASSSPAARRSQAAPVRGAASGHRTRSVPAAASGRQGRPPVAAPIASASAVAQQAAGTGHHSLVWVPVLLVAVALGGGGYLVGRARSRHPNAPIETPSEATTKNDTALQKGR